MKISFFLFCNLIILFGLKPILAGDQMPGDRFPLTDVDLVYPEDCFVHNGGRVIDVTRLPAYISDNDAYNDGTHPDETTDALIDTYDWVLQKLRDAGSSSWNHHKVAYIIYLPDGNYRVNQPIIHRGDAWIRDNSQHEALYGIRFYGQSRLNTILQLSDDTPGFGDKENPATVLAFTKHSQNNSVSMNGLQNLTVHTGSGNPGAVGVDFQGANLSFVRNIKVISGDGEGHAGLRFPIWPTQGYHSDISVEGFDHGIDVVGGMVANGPVLEYITLRNQNKSGLRMQTSISPVRMLHVIDPGGPAVELTTNKGHLVLLDSRFEKADTGSAAIKAPANCQSLYVRNIELASGFDDRCIAIGKEVIHTGNLEGEFVAGLQTTLFNEQVAASLNLPIKESPVIPYDPPGKWISVESKGATGGDASDDSDAIQAALDACDGVNKTTVYFRTGGEFRISKSLLVPAGVRRILFMWGGRINTENLDPEAGVFKVDEPAAQPLILEDYFQHVNGNPGYFLDHAATRPLICRNLRGSRDFSNYRHSGENRDNELYLENVAHMISEGCKFNNRCWARWVNTETAEKTEFLNSGGVLWVLGYKCEDEATNFRTIYGGFTEVLGGIINQYRGGTNHYERGRVFELINSSGSFIASTSGPTDQEYDTIIFEQRGDRIEVALKEDFPVREDNKIHVPLFSGYRWGLYDPQPVLPDDAVSLKQIYPNPFQDCTHIEYYLPRPAEVSLKVFNLSGVLLDTVYQGNPGEGFHHIEYHGSQHPPGLLIFKLAAENSMQTRRMLKIR